MDALVKSPIPGPSGLGNEDYCVMFKSKWFCVQWNKWIILLSLPTVTNFVDESEGRRQLMGFQEPQDFSVETGVGVKQVSRRNMHVIGLLVGGRVIRLYLRIEEWGNHDSLMF